MIAAVSGKGDDGAAGVAGWPVASGADEPPHASVVSSMPAAQFIVQLFPWLVGKNAPGTVRRCVQRDGDVLVLPDRWAHLTYNLRASTGLAREFDLR